MGAPYLFRLLPDDRLLFGSRGDTSGHPKAGRRMRARLVARMRRSFPRWPDVTIMHFWRGLICLTRRLTPCVGPLEDDASVWFGFGYHGNGLNTAPWVGRSLARALASGSDPERAFPGVMRGLAPRFAPSWSRTWVLRVAYAYYRLKDGA